MRTKYVKIINLIAAVMVVLFCVGQVFAWFSGGGQDRKQQFGGASVAAYFAGGDGSKDNPYILTNKHHVYNLAWLQDTKRFFDENGEQVKYYFVMNNDIYMGDMWVPPIGTDDAPFIGDFDGNGCSIFDLKVTTNLSKLTHCPVVNASGFEFSRSVGFFGYTDNKSTENKSEIKNFILENPFIEVAKDNAPYTETGPSHCVAGLAIGRVAGVARSIGVRALDNAPKTALDIFVARGDIKYSTFNSILGEIAEGASASVTGGSGGGGAAGGAGGNFGNTLDTSLLLSRLDNINTIKYPNNEVSYNPWRLPNISKADNGYTLGTGEKLPVAVNSKTPEYKGLWNIYYNGNGENDNGDPYEDISKENTGYYLGSKTTIQNKTIEFVDKSILDSIDYTQLTKTPNWFYMQKNDWYSTEFASINQGTFENLPSQVKDILKSDKSEPGSFKIVGNGETKSFTTVKVDAEYTWQGIPATGPWMELNDYYWSYHGQITWNGEIYGVGFKSDPYNATGESNAINRDQWGREYKYDYLGRLFDDNKYMLNDDCTYIINIPGWKASVYDIDSNGKAIYYVREENGDIKKTYDFYIDGNLIDENNFLFYFAEDGTKRYVADLPGWALPIYGVELTADGKGGYALDADGKKFYVEGYYEEDINGFYMRKQGDYAGTYVIQTEGWQSPEDLAIYFVDKNGYALTDDGLYYTKYWTPKFGVYQIDDTYLLYDENRKPLVQIGENQYLSVYGFDSDGYARNENGYYYTPTLDSYLMQDKSSGIWYRVNAEGKKQIYDNGNILVTPDYFDSQGYAQAYDEVNDRYYYYDVSDNNIFYDKRGNTYYQVRKSADAGNIWMYVIDGSPMVITQIDDRGYAKYNDDWFYTITDGIFEDSKGYLLYDDGGYMMNPSSMSGNGNSANIGYFDENGVLLANNGSTFPHVKGKYATDRYGNAITTTGLYALDENNEITGERMLFGTNSAGQITYLSGPHQGEVVTIEIVESQWYSWTAQFKGVQNNNNNNDNPYRKIQVKSGNPTLARAATEPNGSNLRLKQAQGTLEDRIQATHTSVFTDNHLRVKKAKTNDRAYGVQETGNIEYRPFHRMMGGILLPNNAVWFKPSKAGKIRFVMYADVDDLNFVLLKMERPIHADGTPSFDNTFTSVTKAIQQNLPKNILFYYEYEVSEADIAAGNIEFVIMCDNNSNAGGSHLLYLDIGASALVGDGDDVSTVNPNIEVSAVDFIYDKVSINLIEGLDGIGVGDFIVGDVLYEPTKTRIYFENMQSEVTIVFVRLAGQEDGATMKVNATDRSNIPMDGIQASRMKYVRLNE